MAANIRCIMRAKANYGAGLSKLKVNLTPTQSGTPWKDDTVNNAPYVFRPVPMGNREWNKLVGGTVAWNQRINSLVATKTVDDVVYTNLGNNKMSIVGTSTGNNSITICSGLNFTAGHKYLLLTGQETLARFYFNVPGMYGQSANGVYVPTADATSKALLLSTYIGMEANVTCQFNLIDLTEYLTPTNADYVYTLEQATAGSGIEWLKKYDLIDDQYHAFSAPTLQSVQTSAHVIKDADDQTVETYPLDDVILRGIPKLDNGNLYYDGDTYEWDGTVTRKWAEIDLGTLNWYANGQSGDEYEYAYNLTGKANGLTNMVCSGMIVGDSAALGIIRGRTASSIISTRSTITTKEAFKTAMNGVKLVYELATQTTESADPFTNPQVCDPDGTEEWTDYGVSQGTRDYAVPVGHESTYAMAYPISGTDSFTITANDGTAHTYPVSIGTTIYKGQVDVLDETYVSEMTNIASYNGETIGEPWLSSLDEYSPGTTPTTGAQVVYTSTPTEGSVTVTGDPSTLRGLVSVTSDKGDVDWGELSEIGIKCVMKLKDPFN